MGACALGRADVDCNAIDRVEAIIHPDLASKQQALSELCQRFGVTRLEVFGSAARGVDFDPAASDADFLVTFTPAARDDMSLFMDLQLALEAVLGRPVDLMDRSAVEASRNYIRRRRILAEVEAVFAA